MKEFLYEYYSLLTKSFEILALFVGLIVYKKYKNTQVKYFIWFLGWIVLIEFIGTYPKYLRDMGLYHFIKDTIIERNYWWYTVFWTSATTIFYSWFLSQVYESHIFKKIMVFCRYLFVIILLTTIILDFKNFFNFRANHLVLLNFSIILLSSIFYLFELLNSEKLLNSFKSVYFYIAMILFVWWLVTTPLNFFEIYNSDSDWDYVTIKWTIKLIANIFMYLGFALALIFCNSEENELEK